MPITTTSSTSLLLRQHYYFFLRTTSTMTPPLLRLLLLLSQALLLLLSFWSGLTTDAFSTTPSSSSLSKPLLLHIVVFGRPGAGKSTIADQAVEDLLVQQQQQHATTISAPLGLDLDVCVSQTMRDNFANGVYPTLQERLEFAEEACQYVEQKIEEEKSTANIYIVSFSFVNVDLRDVYRRRFPNAHWMLVDTTEEEAKARIAKRQGHFYKGGGEDNNDDNNNTDDDNNNSEWKFAPVDFPHTKLDGSDSIQQNADKIVEFVRKAVSNRQHQCHPTT